MLLLGVLASLLLTTADAWAHASFVSSQPAPGSDLAAPPGVVRLRFTGSPILDSRTWVYEVTRRGSCCLKRRR